MSVRGAGRNARRNRGRVGPDGLRARERELLDLARAGEPLTPEQGVMLLERLSKLRYGLARVLAERVTVPAAALAEAYDELCSAFVLLLNERDLVDARVAQVNRQRRVAEARAQADVQRLLAEIKRVSEERDDYREAARCADGQRLALQRARARGEVLHV